MQKLRNHRKFRNFRHLRKLRKLRNFRNFRMILRKLRNIRNIRNIRARTSVMDLRDGPNKFLRPFRPLRWNIPVIILLITITIGNLQLGIPNWEFPIRNSQLIPNWEFPILELMII